tara:strand:- start:3374 stop:4153 length:780 start_codon:yes stop_codon:yes gene_type:complete
MPVKPSIFTTVSDGDTLDASDIKDRATDLQRFVNGQVWADDLSTTAFVDTQHIVRPEFYGSPSPRVEGVSSDTIYRKRTGNILDTHYRHEGSGSELMPDFESPDTSDINLWQPVDGMSATIHCHEDNVAALCIGSFRAFERDGVVSDLYSHLTSDLEDQINPFRRAIVAGKYIAEFMLFVDTGSGPVAKPRTRRRVYGSGENQYKCRHMNHSFIQDLTLSEGENKISYRCFYRLVGEDDRRMVHLYLQARNFVVDVLYR